MFKRFIAALALLGFAAGLGACNTVRGIGQDVERGGEKVQDTAKRNQSSSGSGQYR